MLEQDTGLSLAIAQIVQRLKGSSLHSQLERQARGSLHKPEIKLESLKEDIKEFLKTSDLSLFRPVYAPKDFLEVLMNLRNPNYENGDQPSFKNHLGLIQVPLKVKDIPELRDYFSELGLNTGQLGIDDSTQVPPELFENEHVRVGQTVLTEQDSAAAQQYVRQGCPTALRAELWALILNISNQPEDILYYEQLKSNVIQHDLLVDSLIYKDVKLTASNDDYYFVFEDYLYQVLLCFSRDTSVLEHFSYNSATPPKSYIRGKLGVEEYAVFYPPNVLAAAVFAFRAVNLMEVTSLAAAEEESMYEDRPSERQYQEDIHLSDPMDNVQAMQLTQNKSPVETDEISFYEEGLELAESDSELRNVCSPDENVGNITYRMML
ncbi:TBC1 domain family member 19 [Chelonia mydas]|uniref:TBC1 domain family member 19 n=1 Tax=Chelonia mydas TaxID=8469 RepID=M7C9S4_CHEMY|nr:TBC1 domain family member 19 [Chelonia mydas]